MPLPSLARRLILAAAILPLAGVHVLAQPGSGRREGRARGPSIFIRNARVLTMAGPAIEGATIHIAGSNIRQIGTDVEIPEGATVIDAKGMTVTPGLIDADATLGVSYAARGGSPDPSNRAFDAFDRYATDLVRDAVRNGVTTLAISPRTGTGVTGTSAVIRLQPNSDGGAGVVIKDQAALCVDFGSAVAPTQRLETLDRVRRSFRSALDHRDALEIYKEDLEEYEKKIKERAEKEAKEKKPDAEKKPEGSGGGAGGGGGSQVEPPKEGDAKPPTPPGGGGAGGEAKEDDIKKPAEPAHNRGAEVLLKALDRQMPVRFRCERSADILNALDIAKEFNLDAIIDGGTEAYLLAPQLAKAEAKVVLGPSLGRDYYLNDVYRRRSVGGIDALTGAGVACVVGTGRGSGIDGGGPGLGNPSPSRFVLANAQLVAQQSAREINPLSMVTAEAAQFLGVGDQVGRLRPGMLADIVLWTADPLDPAARVRAVYIGGELAYRDESAAATPSTPAADEGENR